MCTRSKTSNTTTRQNSRIALRAKKTQRNCENRAKEIIPGTQPSRKASLRVDKGNSITLRPAATNDIYFSQYEGNNDIIFSQHQRNIKTTKDRYFLVGRPLRYLY